jgi:hypothetical protein
LRRYFFYRRESLKTTWTFRFLLVGAILLLILATRSWWIPATARSVICNDVPPSVSDAILVENYDTEYLLFERAALLRKEGIASRVLVTVPASWDSPAPNLVSVEVVNVMARVAQLPPPEIITVRPVEPLSLSVTQQVRDYLVAHDVRSVVYVASGFRSRRADDLNRRVLGKAGIKTSCVPVLGANSIEGWTQTWHGIQSLALEFLKLQYYRLYVLPFRSS